MTQAQSHNEARRREAEEAVEVLHAAVKDVEGFFDDEYVDDLYKRLEFLAWEAGVLEYFKKLRSE